MTGVLHLDHGEVVSGGPVEVHPAPGVQSEVDGVGGPHQTEAEPVDVVGAIADVGREEALGGGVGAHHEGHVARPGEDLSSGHLQRGGARSAGRVAAGQLGAGEAQGSGEGRPCDVARIAAAHGDGPRHEADVGVVGVGVFQGVAGRGHAVGGEVATPLAPRVHPDTQNGDLVHASVPRPGGHRTPLPDQVVAVVIAVESVDGQLHLHAHF